MKNLRNWHYTACLIVLLIATNCTLFAQLDDAMWDAAFGQPGANGYIRALASDGVNLYAGGEFTEIGGVPASNIARWDGTSWNALGEGVDKAVLALEVFGDKLFVGGEFRNAGGLDIPYLAVWENGGWAPVGGSGMQSEVGMLKMGFAGRLYVGGQFCRVTQMDGEILESPGFTIWSTQARRWGTLGGGVYVDGACWGTGKAIEFDDTYIYAAGDFEFAGGVEVQGIARYNSSGWSAMGQGLHVLPGGIVRVCGVVTDDQGNIIVGGFFHRAGVFEVQHAATWIIGSQKWIPLDAEGFSGIEAVIRDGKDIYFGGYSFLQNPTTVAKWSLADGWQSLGSGVQGQVDALVVGPDGAIYVGGSFNEAGGKVCNNIARWNPIASDVEDQRASSELQLRHTNESGMGVAMFRLAQPDDVTLRVYDLHGALVTTVAAQTLPASLHRLRWSTAGLASGLYIYTLQTSAGVAALPFVLAK